MAISIIITSTSTPICGIGSGIGLGVTCIYKLTTSTFVTTKGASTSFMDNKDKLQEIVASLAPPLIYVSIFMVVATNLFWELTATGIGYTEENL